MGAGSRPSITDEQRAAGGVRPCVLLDMPPLTGADTKIAGVTLWRMRQRRSTVRRKYCELDFIRPLKNLARFRRQRVQSPRREARGVRTIRGRSRLRPARDSSGGQVLWKPRGLVRFTGRGFPAKCHDVAAMLDKINAEREEHMITIEDTMKSCTITKKCLVNEPGEVTTADTPRLPQLAARRVAEDPTWSLIGENAAGPEKPSNRRCVSRKGRTATLTFEDRGTLRTPPPSHHQPYY